MNAKTVGSGLSRRASAREAFLAEEYKHERLSKPELQRLLGIESGYELEYTREGTERERKGLQHPGRGGCLTVWGRVRESPARAGEWASSEIPAV